MDNKIVVGTVLVLCLAWQVHAAVNCTATGAGRFPEPEDTTCKNYTLCVFAASTATYVSYNYVCPSTSIFNPKTAQCTAPSDYVCNVTNNAKRNVCTQDGFFSNPNSTDCTTYIVCVEINGTFTETSMDCPTSTFFNPNTTLCESDYNCTTTFTCRAAGRFANDRDTSCQSYHFCVLFQNGTYAAYDYNCPSTSLFNPARRVCTSNYDCGS